jgi:hypothetical protein
MALVLIGLAWWRLSRLSVGFSVKETHRCRRTAAALLLDHLRRIFPSKSARSVSGLALPVAAGGIASR